MQASLFKFESYLFAHIAQNMVAATAATAAAPATR